MRINSLLQILKLIRLSMELNPVLNGHILPRIYSHTKLALRHTSHAKTIQEQSNQTGTLKRSASAIPNRNLHSANTSKAIKLQTTTAVFHNKAEQLQRLQNSLNKQIQSIKAEIAKLRIKKKGAQDTVSVISSRISSVVPEQGRNKTDALRRRLDKQRERAKKTMTEVQNVRKDILTTKKLNTQIAEEIQNWDKQLSAETALASKLDEVLALKTTQVQKKKVEMVHQKAKIIKQYDAIRHKLDNELNSQGGKSNAAYFYLTDLTSAEVIQKKRSQLLVENSPKGHKVGNRAEYFKEKMDEWKGQTETIKEKVNAKSLEEAEQKLMEIHENNYHHYKFINQRHAALQELKQRNSQLKQQKSSLMREIVEKEHSHTTQAITTTKSKIRKTQETQKELKDKIAESQQIYQRTKSFICEFIRQSGLVLPVQETAVTIQQQVNKTTLSAFLQSLLQLKQRGFQPSENAHSQ